MLSTFRRFLNSFRQGASSVSTSEIVSPVPAPLAFEQLEDRILLTILGVPANDQGVWTFVDADDDQIRLVVTTGPSSGAILDVYDQNGAHMDFDSVPGGPFGPPLLFSGPTNIPSSGAAGPAPSCVAVGDMNGDTNLDLVVANTGTDQVSVLFGTGTGTFGAPVDYSLPGLGSAGINPAALALGDFDGDTDLDVAVATQDPNPARTSDFVTVLRNNGAGVLTWVADNPVGILPSSVAVGDFNTDGAWDLAVANSSVLDPLNDPYTFSVLLGAGGGTFGPAVFRTAGTQPVSIFTADFDHDNDFDIAVANSGDDTVSVFLGTGTGAFAENILGGSPFAVGREPVFIAGGQTNDDAGPDPGDGFAADGVIDIVDHFDLVVANHLGDSVTVLQGVGNGSFTTAQTIALPTGSRPSSVALGLFDLEGDGLVGGIDGQNEFLDLAVTNEARNNVSVFLGQGLAGGFVAAANRDYNADVGPAWIAVGDFNPDGTDDLHDLVIANPPAGTLSILIATEALEGPDDPNHLDIGYIDIQSSGVDTNIFINEYTFSDDTDTGIRELTIVAFSGDNTPGDGTEPNFASLPHFAQPSIWGADPPWIGPPGGAVWVRGDIFTSGANQDVGRILIGGTFGIDDAHGNNAAGQPGAADGTAFDNGAIRITGSSAGISVGFLAGSIVVTEDLNYLTVEDNGGFIARVTDEPNPYQDEGPTFRNGAVNIGWDLGFVESGRAGEGHWRTPITVTGTPHAEAAVYTDAGAGSTVPTAAPVRAAGENFFQIIGAHVSGDGADYFAVPLVAGETIHLFAERGEMVRLFDTTGTLIPGSPMPSGGYFTRHHGNYVVPADGVYYVAVSWTDDDANLDGLDDTFFQNGPVNPDAYDLYVGVSSDIYYEQEIIEGSGLSTTTLEPLVPISKAYLTTEDIANDTPDTAEFIPLANGTVTVHGVLGTGEDLDRDGTIDLFDNVDVYRLVVEAGTRIIAGVNNNALDPLYDPTPLENAGFITNFALGLLDEEGNVMSSSWVMDAGRGTPFGRGADWDDGYVNYLVPEAGVYYLAVTWDPEDVDFTGDPGADSGTADWHYEIFVTGTSTRQTMAGLDTNSGILGPGPFADNFRGNIDLLTHDVGALFIGSDLLAVNLDVRAGDLVYLQTPVIGDADEADLTGAFASDPVITISDNIHRVDGGAFERGLFDVGQDLFQFVLTGDFGGDLTSGAYRASVFTADDIGIFEVGGILWGNGGVRPDIVIDYDMVNAPGDSGTIDYLHVGSWGSSSTQAPFVVTPHGGNVRFVEVDNEGIRWSDPVTGWNMSIGLTTFDETTWEALTLQDDSGATMFISVDSDGPPPPIDPDDPIDPEDIPPNAPAASGSYQRIPIHGTNVPLNPLATWTGGTTQVRFIGWAFDDLTINAGEGDADGLITQVALFTNGQMDLGTLTLTGSMELAVFSSAGNNSSTYFREITGGGEGSSMGFFGRTDVVGITGDSFDFIRIYNGNLGWTPAATNDGNFTGYRPGTFTGPWLVQEYESAGSPDLTISGLQLDGSVGELSVSRTIFDVEIGGTVGGEEFLGEEIEIDEDAAVDAGVPPQFLFSDLSHKIKADADNNSANLFLNGKVFEGIAGSVYVGTSVGNITQEAVDREGLGGIDLGGGLLHSGSGATPIAGIFSPGQVSQIFCSGPDKVLSGDIFVGILGVTGTFDAALGGLVLTNDARIYDLHLTGSTDYTEAYDSGGGVGVIEITVAGALTNLVMSGSEARIVGLLLAYSEVGNIRVTGHGMLFSTVRASEVVSTVGIGEAVILHTMHWGVSTHIGAIRIAGFGIFNCTFSSIEVDSITTTDRFRGDFTNSELAATRKFTFLNVAHDIIGADITTIDFVSFIKAGNNVNGLTLSSNGIGVLEAQNNLFGLDVNSSGLIKRVEAKRGAMTGPRITGFGPWATIHYIIAWGNISVTNITSWGTIKQIKSKTGTITGTVTTLGPNASVNNISTAVGLAVNLILNGPLNNLVVRAGNLSGFLQIAGRIGTINVVAGSITAAATITAGGPINAIIAGLNIGGAGHFITAAGRIGKVQSRNGSITSTITSNDTSNRAVNLVQAGLGAIAGAITAPFGGIGRVIARNGAVNAVVTAALGITGVESRNGNITGAITANGGNINLVRARNGNITATAVITALAGRIINVQASVIGGVGHAIFASGRISTVKSLFGNVFSTITSNSAANNAINMVEARNGDVNGAVNAPFGGITNVKATWNRAAGTGGNINATVNANLAVNRVQATGQAGNPATGNITGAINSTTSKVGNVKAINGNVAATATVTAATDVTRVEGAAIGGVGHTITAGGRVKNIQSKAGAVTTTVTAGAAHNTAIGNVRSRGGAVNATLNAAAGGVGNVTGDSLNVVINANRRVGNLQSTNGNLVATATSLTNRIGNVQARNGNVSGVFNAFTQIGMAKAINGSVTGANFSAGTTMGGIQTTGAGAGDIVNVNARAGTRMGTVKSNRDIINTQVSARTQLSGVRAMRDAITCLFASGYDFGADFTVGTADDTLQTGRTGAVTILRNAQDMNVVAGVGPGVDAIFGNGNDVGAGGAGRISSVRAATFITTGPSFGIEADAGSFIMRDGAGNRITAGAAAQAFPGTTYNVQVL